VTPGRDDAPPSGDSDRPADATFHALTRALTDQWEAARDGRLERVAELAEQVDALLAEARKARRELSEADRQALLDQHGRLCLALAQQQSELAGRRQRLRRGRRGARAYARTTP